MHIHPKYRVVRVIRQLRDKQETIQLKLKRARSERMRTTYIAAIDTLDFAIKLLREEIR